MKAITASVWEFVSPQKLTNNSFRNTKKYPTNWTGVRRQIQEGRGGARILRHRFMHPCNLHASNHMLFCMAPTRSDWCFNWALPTMASMEFLLTVLSQAIYKSIFLLEILNDLLGCLTVFTIWYYNFKLFSILFYFTEINS